MRLTFGFPSSGEETGGVMVLYEFANALSRRGHEVTFVHGPAWPTRISSLDQLPDICRRDGVRHLIVDALDDPSIPESDVMFSQSGPARLGLPCIFVQGFGMLSEEWERDAFRERAPKICVASWLTEVGRTFGVPAEQLIHVPNGIDHATFNLQTPLDQRPIDVAALSHPHPEKGWPILIEALRQLSASRSDFSGVVFGRNQPPDELPRGVRFVSSPDHAELAADVYGKCRVFVQASYREGFGLTPVEAMACGAALVTTDNGGSRDYGINGVTAKVVPTGDGRALADAVTVLLDDDAERQRLSRAGSEHIAMFDWDRSAGLIDDLLQRYLAEPSEFQRPPAILT